MSDILLRGRRLIACICCGPHVLELVLGVDVLADVALSDERDAVARRLRVWVRVTSIWTAEQPNSKGEYAERELRSAPELLKYLRHPHRDDLPSSCAQEAQSVEYIRIQELLVRIDYSMRVNMNSQQENNNIDRTKQRNAEERMQNANAPLRTHGMSYAIRIPARAHVKRCGINESRREERRGENRRVFSSDSIRVVSFIHLS